MISVSQLAASVLLETLKESGVKIGQSFRLAQIEKGFTLELGNPMQSDRVVRYEGDVVLIVDRNLENEIGDARIDVEENAHGRGLVMRRAANPDTSETTNLRIKKPNKKEDIP
jgi:hypothetical protein